MSGFLTKTAAARLAGLIAAALAASAAGAAAQGVISFPPSRSLSDIAAWLARDTPLTPAQVVDVSPAAVTAITSATPMGETRGFRASISSEAVDPQMLAHDGIASWTIPVEVDCGERRVRLGAMTGYRGRDLQSDPRIVREADTAWVNPTPSAPLGAVIRALCDRNFQRPLAGPFKVGAKGRAAPKPPREGKPMEVVANPTPKRASATPAPTTADASGAPLASPAPAPTHTPTATASAAPQTRPPQPPTREAATPAPAKTPSPPKSIPIPGVAATSEPPAEKPLEKPRPKLKPPAGGGPVSVQIGASPNVKDTQTVIERFRKKFGGELGGLTTSVATVQADGKTLNRALVTGFKTTIEATRYCEALNAQGQPCFVRR
jgi:hypothetical protein